MRFLSSLREHWCKCKREQGGLLLRPGSVLGWQVFVNRDGGSRNDVSSTQETGGHQAEGDAKMLFFTV